MKPKRKARIFSVILIVLGMLLMTGSYWNEILFPLIFDKTGNYRTDGIAKVFNWISNLLLGGYWGLGEAILFVGLLFLFFSYEPKPDRAEFFNKRRFGLAAMFIALSANTIVMLCSSQFFFVPRGGAIRPMGWALEMSIIALFTFIIVSSLSIISAIKERRFLLAAAAFILGCLPFILASFTLRFISWLVGFELED